MSLTIKEYGEGVFTNYLMDELSEINSTLFKVSEISSDQITLTHTYTGAPLGEKVASNSVLKQVFQGNFTNVPTNGINSIDGLVAAGFSGSIYSSKLFVNGLVWEEVGYAPAVSLDLINQASTETNLEALSALYAGDDVFVISKVMQSGHNDINGYGGNDTFYGSRMVTTNADIFVGGSGLDRLILDRPLVSYQIESSNNIWNAVNQRGELAGCRINDTSGSTNRIEISDVERIQFSDVSLALDIAKGETAGSAYRIYKAAFDRVPDAGGLGFWINAMDDGASLTSVAAGFINSPEFKQLYGANVTDRDFVTKVYTNVLDRNPDQGGYDFWLGAMGRGATRADILASFSESPENIGNVADLIANGIQYEAWVV